MKTKILLVFLIAANYSFAQFDDILKKTIGSKDAWIPGKSITSSINDVLPQVSVLDFLEGIEPEPLTDINNMKPGYYRGNIQSYCIKAGTYGPTKGNGYLIGPLLGKNADIVESILNKSVMHPDIKQRDIQLLLWAIEAGTKFDDLPMELKLRVKPLLSSTDLVRLNVDINDALDILPAEIVDLAKFYKGMRDVIKNPKSSYEDVERLAVNTTGVEVDLKENIDAGKWAYIGDNYYIRTFPISYPTTTLEILCLPQVNVVRDSKKRITSISGNGYTTEIEYDDAPGRDILSTTGNPDMPIWRFKKLTFTNEGEQVVIENRGWIIRDGGKPITGSTGQGAYIETDSELNTPSYDRYMSRYNANILGNTEMKNSITALKKNKGQGEKQEISDFNPDKDIHDGMKAATNPTDFKNKSKWFNNNLSNTLAAWKCSISALAGGSCEPTPPKPPLPKFPSLPSNSGKQRLANSTRSAE